MSVMKRLEALAQACERALMWDVGDVGWEPPHRCAHLDEEPVARLCGQHPVAGLLCAGCWSAHADRHQPAGCIECGAAEALGQLVTSEVEGRVATRSAMGVPSLWVGTVVIRIGVVCDACRA